MTPKSHTYKIPEEEFNSGPYSSKVHTLFLPLAVLVMTVPDFAGNRHLAKGHSTYRQTLLYMIVQDNKNDCKPKSCKTILLANGKMTSP